MNVLRTSRGSGLVKEETGRASSLDKRRGVSQKPLGGDTDPQNQPRQPHTNVVIKSKLVNYFITF